MERLRELEAQGHIKIWTPDEVYEALQNGPKKLRKKAADVRAAMQKNGEILIEGQIPPGMVQGTN